MRVKEDSQRLPYINLCTPAIVLSGNIAQSSSNISINEAALALTRSLGRRGVKVYRFHPDQSLSDLKSRYGIHIPCPNLYDRPADLVDMMMEFARNAPARPVLFPASDDSARFIAANEKVLATHFALTSPSASCLAEAENKQSLIKAAQAAEVDVPQTYFPTSLEDIKEIARSISFPVLLKPLYSSDWKTERVRAVVGQVKVLKIDDMASFVERCEKVLSLGTPFMVQEAIPGPDDNLLTFIGYVGGDGRLLAGCVRKKLRQFPAGFGYCTLTETIEDLEIIELTKDLFRTLGYRGIGCVEFKRDARTGQAKLIEIKTHAVRTSALPIAAGVDFPWIAYQDSARPSTVEPVLTYRVPVRWIHVYDELKSVGSLIRKRRLSLFEWLNGFRRKRLVSAEFSWDDMRPAFLYWYPAPWKLMTAIGRRLPGRKKTNPSLDAEAVV